MKYLKALIHPFFLSALVLDSGAVALAYWVGGTLGVAACFVTLTVMTAYRDTLRLKE